MKQFIKKYITICIAVFIMLTSSINADAYELWGNDAASEDGDIVKGIVLNLIDLATVYDEDIATLKLEHDISTGDYMSVIESLGDSTIETALGDYGIFYSTSKFCTQSFLDFFGSVYNVPGSYKSWYKSIKSLYGSVLKGIMKCGKQVYVQGCKGISLSPEQIINLQAYIDSAHEIADIIRNDSKSFLFHRREIYDCAEKLDELANNTDINKLYSEGLAKYNASNTYSFYAKRERDSCDAAAVFHMICMYKKINTTQSDIMAVAENNFWNKCEPYYGLNDDGSYVTLCGSSQGKINEIKNCLRNTPAIIKISNNIAPYYYTYIVVVFRDNMLYILDPTANSNKGFTVSEYGDNHGLSETEVYNRMLAAWSYC